MTLDHGGGDTACCHTWRHSALPVDNCVLQLKRRLWGRADHVAASFEVANVMPRPSSRSKSPVEYFRSPLPTRLEWSTLRLRGTYAYPRAIGLLSWWQLGVSWLDSDLPRTGQPAAALTSFLVLAGFGRFLSGLLWFRHWLLHLRCDLAACV